MPSRRCAAPRLRGGCEVHYKFGGAMGRRREQKLALAAILAIVLVTIVVVELRDPGLLPRAPIAPGPGDASGGRSENPVLASLTDRSETRGETATPRMVEGETGVEVEEVEPQPPATWHASRIIELSVPLETCVDGVYFSFAPCVTPRHAEELRIVRAALFEERHPDSEPGSPPNTELQLTASPSREPAW